MSRRDNRNKITRSEANKQNAVTNRYRKMFIWYCSMSHEQLKEIEHEKRSNTDNFAYKTAVIEVKRRESSAGS